MTRSSIFKIWCGFVFHRRQRVFGIFTTQSSTRCKWYLMLSKKGIGPCTNFFPLRFTILIFKEIKFYNHFCLKSERWLLIVLKWPEVAFLNFDVALFFMDDQEYLLFIQRNVRQFDINVSCCGFLLTEIRENIITIIKNIDKGVIYYIFRFKMRCHRHYSYIHWLVVMPPF